MKINVTQADINGALLASRKSGWDVCGDCPIARAVERAFHQTAARVGTVTIVVGEKLYFMPTTAQNFIEKGWETGQPFNFDLE